MIVYDITKERSFEDVQEWIDRLKDKADPDVVMVLVGNRAELVEKDPLLRKVPVEKAKRLANKYDMFFVETSSLSDQNVILAFEKLLEGNKDCVLN